MLEYETDKYVPVNEQETLWVYNGLDVCLTNEILEALLPQLGHNTKQIYKWEFASQSLALEMMIRGLRVDQVAVHETLIEAEREYNKYYSMLQQIAEATWGMELNPNSPSQLQKFFYEAMNIKPIMKRGRVTTDRAAMEEIQQINLYACPAAKLVLLCHDWGKILSVLRTDIDTDGRMRCSYAVAGTETGRWASKMSAFGTGTNLQNITNHLRKIFVADPGQKFAYIDLHAAESKGVGYISGDENYIKACDEGDAHTVVARLVWTDLPWTGDIKKDKAIASETPFYRENSVRDMAKRGGHGTNYYGKPENMAGHLKMPVPVVAHFQQAYFQAFPGIPHWHQRVISTLQTTRTIVTSFGRQRLFFDNPSSNSTIREAIAYEPQSTIADTLNFGAYKVQQRWHGGKVKCMAQLHDAVLVSYPEDEEDTLLPEIMKTMLTPVKVRGREMIIDLEAESGWNWCHYNKKDPSENPDGIRGYNGHDDRTRQVPANTSVLDWKLD